MRRGSLALALTAPLTLAQCAEPPPPPVAARVVDPAGLVRVRGLWRPEIGPDGAKLRVHDPPNALQVRCPDGSTTAFHPAPADRPTIVCPGGEPGARGEIALVQRGHVVAHLPVQRAAPPHPALAAIGAARRADDRPQAHALIDAAAADPGGPRAWALALERARLADPDPAPWRAAAAAAAHRPLDAARALRLGAHRLLWAQRYPEAGALAEDALRAAAAAGHAVGVALGHYYLGLVDQQLGRFRRAEAHLERAAAGVRAAGRDADAVGFELARANLLQDRGHHAAALARLDAAGRDLERLGEPGALRVHFDVDAGWIRLRAMIAGHLEPDYPGLMAHFAALEAPSGPRRANAMANLALAALRAGELQSARTALDGARRADPRATGFSAAFVDLLTIELALAEGDPRRALDLCRASAERIAAGAAHLRWRRFLLEGRAHAALGDAAGADAAWRAGIDAIREQASGVGVARGRSAFFSDRQAIVEALVDLRLAREDVVGAFAVADEARLQVLRGTAARLAIDRLDPAVARRWAAALSAWRRARDAFEADRFGGDGLAPDAHTRWMQGRAAEQRRIQRLFDAAEAVLAVPQTPEPVTPAAVQAALPAGQALIAFTRRGPARWVGVYVDGERLEARAVDPADPLGPWAERIAGLGGLMIVDGGLPAARDLPPAPDGRPWTAHIAIGWLPAAGLLPRPHIAGAAPPVVIADPTGDLPHARAEGRALAAATGARLIAGGEATESRVIDALRDARWLHYAGHGSPGEDGPWDARLTLADGVSLTAVELMLARAAPRVAVLSACRTVRTGSLASAEPWGLPEMLVALGTRSVLAADVLLDDAAARRFVARFHAAGGVEAPGEAFRAAVAGSIAADDPGWKGWRLVGRP